MSTSVILAALLMMSAFAYYVGHRRAYEIAGGSPRHLHSLPAYHGLYVAVWCGLPSILIVLLWSSLAPWITDQVLIANLPADAASLDVGKRALLLSDLKRYAAGEIVGREITPGLQAAAESYARARAVSGFAMASVAGLAAIGGLALSRRLVGLGLRARNKVESVLKVVMMAASTIAILTTIGIFMSLIFETVRFFDKVPFFDFLLGLKWSPQTALRADQVAATGAFGAIPLFVGTFLITFLAMCVAVPVGLFSAIYMSEYASSHVRSVVKPVLEILAGVPTVVFGFFAALTVAPLFRTMGESMGLDVASESALAAGVVMGVMIIPFVSSLSDDVMTAVPQALRDGAYALGATKSETIRQVVLPAALPGIVGSILLAISRAIGETMIVVMAAGLAANLTLNPLEAVTTVTVQIVTLLVGDQEFDSAKTLAAFALGLTLFLITLGLNVIALRVVRRYRERYD